MLLAAAAIRSILGTRNKSREGSGRVPASQPPRFRSVIQLGVGQRKEHRFRCQMDPGSRHSSSTHWLCHLGWGLSPICNVEVMTPV